MALVKIGNRTVLDTVDRDTKFSAAVLTRGESTAGTWTAIVHSWVASYVGYSDTAILDQGSQFQSAEFASLLSAAVINRKVAGTESHNSFREVERCHAYVCMSATHLKIRTSIDG